MSLWPKEHGAYGQVTFPLITAFAVGGLSAGGALAAAAVIAGFLAHEPAAVLLGLRGQRARRTLRRPAAIDLAACVLGGAAAGGAAIWSMDPAVRWSMAVPVVPALALAATTLRKQEKSWYGEVAAALAFSGAAVPVVLAAGAGLDAALTVAVPFALLFVTTTLAVRVVILRVRGGGDPRAAAATRHATIALTAGGAAMLAAASGAGLLPAAAPIAAAPGLLTAGAIAVRPPVPARLRRVGWTLVAVSVLTAALVISAA